MTHIDVHIHEDSLQFFDVLLLCTPTLLAKNFYNILPSFLDMISKLRADSKPGRTLSVNLGSKMTSIKWRSKVLSRLHQFLEVFAKEKQHNDYLILQNKKDLTKISHIYNKEKVNYFPIYKQTVQSKLSCFYKNKIENMTNDTEMDKIKSYIDSLLPLLFETWLEIRPDSNDTKVESSISEETSFLLKCILEIILMFWNIINTIENEYRSNDLSTWFKKTYYQKFSEYFLLYFPYTCNTASNKRNQSKQKPINSTNDMCLLQNLMIVHIYIIFKDNNVTANLKENKQTIIFTKNNIKEICNGDTKVQKELLSCLKKILSYEDFPKSSSVVDLLNALTTIYTSNDLPKSFEQDLFEVLCVILKHNDFKKLLKFDSISLWLHAIIDMLISSSNISVEVFDIILQFAIHHNELFNATLRENLVKVLHNLPKITLNGADNQSSKHKVISLLFWVKPWDNQCLNIISEQLNTDVYSLDDKEFLVDLLKLKVEAVHG